MPSASEGEGRVVMTDFVRLLEGGDDAENRAVEALRCERLSIHIRRRL